MQYLRRFLWFIAIRMFWVIVISGVLIVSFYIAMNTANIYILLEDGLDARAGVVLTHKDPTELTKFFGIEFLRGDELLHARTGYEDYDIRGYDHSMSLEWVWSWPWEIVARATVVEDVPRIDGKIKSAQHDAAVAAGGEAAVNPPDWPAARYQVTLTRSQGQWKITNMQRLEALSP